MSIQKTKNYTRCCIIIIIIIIIISISIIIYLLESFSALADGLNWSLCDSKSPQVSRTLLGILAVLNNTVDWMITTRPPTSNSSSPFNNPLVTVPKAPITNDLVVIFMSLSFFNL